MNRKKQPRLTLAETKELARALIEKGGSIVGGARLVHMSASLLGDAWNGKEKFTESMGERIRATLEGKEITGRRKSDGGPKLKGEGVLVLHIPIAHAEMIHNLVGVLGGEWRLEKRSGGWIIGVVKVKRKNRETLRLVFPANNVEVLWDSEEDGK